MEWSELLAREAELDELEIDHGDITKRLMQLLIKLRQAGRLPKGPMTLDGAWASHVAFVFRYLLADFMDAQRYENGGVLAWDAQESIERTLRNLRKYMGHLTGAHSALVARICSNLQRQILEAQTDLTAEDKKIHSLAYIKDKRARLGLEALGQGADAFQAIEIAADEELGSKIRPGRGSLASRLNADPVSVLASGFLDFLCSQSGGGVGMIGVLVGKSPDGKPALEEFCDLLDAFWSRWSRRAAIDEYDINRVRDRFKMLLRAAQTKRIEVAREITATVQATTAADGRALPAPD